MPKNERELIQIANTIRNSIKAIGETRREIEQKGQLKARAISEYDKKLAVTLANLRNGELYELGGKQYTPPPVTIMEKIAKGICADERYVLELAESGYKATISNLEALKAQLNALQSLFRHLEEV